MEREMDRELRFHIEQYTEDLMRHGVPIEEAKRRAHVEFGAIEARKEECREAMGLKLFVELWGDLRYAFRMLRKTPSFTSVAAISLALGIGANISIFSFADWILTRPVNYPKINRLVSIVERTPPDYDDESLAPANYRDLTVRSDAFESVAAYEPWSAALTGPVEPEQIQGLRTTANLFTTLGVNPAIGRTFFSEEQQPGNEHVVVISDGFWQRSFGHNSDVLGRNIRLDGEAYTIIGVMPAGFHFPFVRENFWAPLVVDSAKRNERREQSISIVGRLRQETSLERARAEIQTTWSQLQKEYPDVNGGHLATVVEWRRFVVSDDHRRFTLFLLGVVSFVLIIACANVANMQLARAAGRQKEVALRRALGARRGRVMRQLLTESLVLSVAGAVLGLVIAMWGMNMLKVGMPPEVSAVADVNAFGLNWRALVFASCAAIVAALLTGFAPAAESSRVDLNAAIKESDGRTTSGRAHRLRKAFVIAELALALILLIGAGLIVKGFTALVSASPEIDPSSLLTFKLQLASSSYRDLRKVQTFYANALERISALPGVRSAAVISGLPYSFYDESAGISIEGQSLVPAAQLAQAMVESCSIGYFRTMGLPIRSGREFNRHDSADALPVAIISESMAQRLWPGSNAIGKRFKLGAVESEVPWVTVVGIASDTRHEVYDRSFRSVVYRPFEQTTPRSMDFAIRVTGEPARLVPTIRAAIAELDNNRPIEQSESMTAKIQAQASSLQFVASLMSTFGLVALLLAAVGVYGVMSYSVGQLRNEIGIRIALGAQTGDVLRNVLSRGLALTVGGLTMGFVAALILAKMLSSFLYGVRPWDLAIFGGVPGALALISLIATYIPARRAMKVDPNVALRYE
jgi:putative ABC transport system permease protein